MKQINTVITGPRVLLVGGHTEDTQFNRRIKELGCEVYWSDGNKGRSFPMFCDALVCAKFQISHNGFWAAKEAYKNRPTFIADHSWSTIKERFEAFVSAWKLKNQPIIKHQTILGEAMSKAIDHSSKPPADFRGRDLDKLPKNMRHQYTSEMKARINEAVVAHYKASMTPREASEQMAKMGITLADGRPFTASHVSVRRAVLGLAGTRQKAKAAKKLAKKEEREAAKAAAAETSSPVKSNSPDKIVYELILHANLPPQETTALMRKCMEGKLSEKECLKFIELYNDLKQG